MGRALDNVMIERFWRSLKYEEVYLKNYLTPREARKEIFNYMDFYNYERPHQLLGDCYPVEFYQHPITVSEEKASSSPVKENFHEQHHLTFRTLWARKFVFFYIYILIYTNGNKYASLNDRILIK